MTTRQHLERELERKLAAMRHDDPKRPEFEAVLGDLRTGTLSGRVLAAIRRKQTRNV